MEKITVLKDKMYLINSTSLTVLKNNMLSINAIEILQKDKEFGKFTQKSNGWFNSNKRESLGLKQEGNKWIFNWASQSRSGDFLDLLMFYYSLSFKEALVLCYISGNLEEIQLPAERLNKVEITTVSKIYNNMYEELESYDLCGIKQQHIEYFKYRNVCNELLERLIKQNYITFTYNNIVFNWIDEKYGLIKGAQQEGIWKEKRFKKILNGSDSNISFNFNLKESGEIETLIFTEGVWDALAFAELYKTFLNKKSNVKFISMNGLKKNIVEEYIRNYKGAEVVLAVDKDKAADTFFTKRQEDYSFIKRAEVKQEGCKDFGQVIQSKQQLVYNLNNCKNTDIHSLLKESYKNYKNNGLKEKQKEIIDFYNSLLKENILQEKQKDLILKELAEIKLNNLQEHNNNNYNKIFNWYYSNQDL